MYPLLNASISKFRTNSKCLKFSNIYNYCLEKVSFYSLSLEKKTKICARIFGEHLAAIFRGMCVGWRHSSCDPHGATREELQGDGWNLHASVKGGLPFVDLDGLLDLSPVVVVLPSYYSNVVHFYHMTRVFHLFCNIWCYLAIRRGVLI